MMNPLLKLNGLRKLMIWQYILK